MIEILISIILLPVAALALLVMGGIVAGIFKGLKK